MLYKKGIYLFTCLLPLLGLSQTNDTLSYDGIVRVIYLDSFVVTAKKKGFSTESFIKKVREDKTFYQAFRNLRFVNYKSDNQITFYNKKYREKANYSSKTQQWSDGKCRITHFLEEQASPKFFKRKDYRYYTAKLYDKVFFSKDTVCDQPNSPAYDENAKGIHKHYQELKKLIFEPGTKVDVPFIGKKMALFDEKMTEYYDYSIRIQPYKNVECYVFTAKVKEEFQAKKRGKTVIKYMETFFERNSFQILARNYHLVYYGAVFNFDVEMSVQLTKKGNKYLPELVEYDGRWDIPLKKPEIAKFKARLYDFELP